MYKERLTTVDFIEDTGFLLKSLEKRTFLEFISMWPNADSCEPQQSLTPNAPSAWESHGH